ncbi:MAG: hypothetical protein C0473_04630 [Cyanobacteria bacterium DS3.002]|nr:hypothetical protein [Cyanobacteria bacterium DS3.002]MBA4049985.1 hypothetical protein [Cyanobacteria bacterium DS2.008]MBA4074991.1 hypothetical protein [Cyanobacteria bacterium PR.023]
MAQLSTSYLSDSDQSFATCLMHIQCWCWGCDIRREQGNLLLERNFKRVQPPSGVRGSSCYFSDLESGKSVLLWGFGAAIGSLDRKGRGANIGVYINRYRFYPVAIRLPSLKEGIWAPDQLCPVKQKGGRSWQSSLGLLHDLASWIAAYEASVESSLGKEYRVSCLQEMPERELCLLSGMPAAWRSVAQGIADLRH